MKAKFKPHGQNLITSAWADRTISLCAVFKMRLCSYCRAQVHSHPTAAPSFTSSFSLVPTLNIWRLESHCLLSGNISAAYLPLEKGEKDKGEDGKNTPCCVNPGEGLEPCHSSLSLHQLSLIATEDRIPRAQLFLILFGASEAWKAKGLLLIFFC